MLDETDLSLEKNWFNSCLAEKAISNLKKNHMDAIYATDRTDALAKILEMIPEGSTIGFADSITLHQIGLFDHLASRKPAKVISPMQWDADGTSIYDVEQRLELQHEVLTADVYITGVNAVTLDGKLVSTDGRGNRVAPMIFGPGMIIFVAGINKIVPDAEAARDRIRRVCAPINAKRHFEKHKIAPIGELPCAKTGFCVDCNYSDRICCFTVIIEGSGVGKEPKKVIIVGEELGI